MEKETKEEVRKSNRNIAPHCARHHFKATGDIIGGGFRAGCAVSKKNELNLGRRGRIGASSGLSRLENDTLVVLLLFLGSRRLEGSNDCLECVNDAVLDMMIWIDLPRQRRP